jgi:hypothetical protein
VASLVRGCRTDTDNGETTLGDSAADCRHLRQELETGRSPEIANAQEQGWSMQQLAQRQLRPGGLPHHGAGKCGLRHSPAANESLAVSASSSS